MSESRSFAETHSLRLQTLIREEIAAAGGAIPFSRFMELALYAPGLGYYSAGAMKFGAAGDFVTAPELGTLFAECAAEAIAPIFRQLQRKDPSVPSVFFEIGGGTGAFAEAAISHLNASNALPDRYAILEPSADLRDRQRRRLCESLPADLYARVEWLDRPMDAPWQGALFANEVIDALPTPRFTIYDGEVFEEHVAFDAKRGLIAVDRPADALLTAAVRHVERDLGEPFAERYRSELLPQLPYWIQAVVGGLQTGALLFFDYGYPRREYYRPDRTDGTLRAFHRHALVRDVLQRPGLQDITASVDFTALAEAGTHAGFDLVGYCTQASFLIGNGLEQRLASQSSNMQTEAERYSLRQEAKQLTHPDAMGERFSAMGFMRGVDFEHAFIASDLSFRL